MLSRPVPLHRFRDDPFLVTAVIRQTNPIYQEAAALTHAAAIAGNPALGLAPPPENARPTCLLQPLLHDPAVYVDEYVGGQFGWAKADVTIDGVKIDNGNMEDQGFHYAAVNRAFSTERLRIEKYGRPMRGIAHSGERAIVAPEVAVEGLTARPQVIAQNAAGANVEIMAVQAARAYVPAVPRQTHPRMKEAMEMISYDGKWESVPITFRLGFDGVFPLSSENNALRVLTRQRNDTGLLRPGTKINIQIHRRSSALGSCIERIAVGDAVYFAGTDIPDADADPNMTMEIKSIVLVYETSVLTVAQELDRVQGSKVTPRYFHDSVIMRTYQLGEDRTFDSQKVVLPQYCRLVYLMWLHESQIMPGSRKHNFLSARHRFPPGLEEVKLDLLGHDGLVFKEGLQGMGGGNGQSSVSLVEQHNNMMRLGLYERPYSDFVPKAGGIGYQQVLLLDLLPYMLHLDKSSVNLNVTMKYSAFAAKRWSLRAYCMVQRKYECGGGKKWTHVDL